MKLDGVGMRQRGAIDEIDCCEASKLVATRRPPVTPLLSTARDLAREQTQRIGRKLLPSESAHGGCGL